MNSSAAVLGAFYYPGADLVLCILALVNLAYLSRPDLLD